MAVDFEVLLEDIASAAHRSWDAAIALPPAAYTSAELLELERERVFRRSWICVGRADEIRQTGAFMTSEVDRTPIAAVRQKDGTIRAFANVCSHRSMPPISGRGTAKGFTCPYHGWTYGLDGRLISAPAMRPGFCKSDKSLRELRLEEWLGFLFVNLDDSASSVAESLSPLSKLVADFRPERMQTFRRDALYWKCNWKVALENGIEPYHITMTHPETLAPIIPVSNAEMRRGHPNFFAYEHRSTVPAPDTMPAHFIPTTSGAAHTREVAVAGAIYPNIAYAVAHDWLWWISCNPISPSETRIDHGIAAAFDLKGAKPDPTDPAYYFLQVDEAFMREDLDRVEAVQRGAASGYARQGELSPYEEPIYGFIRYLHSKLNSEPANAQSSSTRTAALAG